MKAENMKVFASAVLARIQKSEAIGAKATWGTQDHLKAVAQCLAAADVPAGADVAQVFHDILSDTYNISAFCQYLEGVPAFKAAGHFQREKKGAAVKTDAFYEMVQGLAKPAPSA